MTENTRFLPQNRDLRPTLHIVRNLYFQHSPPFLTGSLSVECQSLLKVKVKDSVGLRPYSQLECSAAQLTESKGKGQCGPRRELRVKVKTSKTPAARASGHDIKVLLNCGLRLLLFSPAAFVGAAAAFASGSSSRY